MNISKQELEKFKEKIRQKEQLIYLTVSDPYSKKKLKFTIKNNSTYWRAKTLFTKEPGTIEWIRGFEKESVFYDIGANVGVYSLYAAKISNAKVYSFEPESNNFQALMENILINNLNDFILPFPIGLSNKNELTNLNLSEFVVASSHHTVGKYGLDHNSLKKITNKHKQGIFSTTLDDLHFNWKLPFPDHIKIDVDGIENKIIEGGSKTLKNPQLKSILIEINSNRKEDKKIIDKLKYYRFLYDEKQINDAMRLEGPHAGYAEYIFYR